MTKVNLNAVDLSQAKLTGPSVADAGLDKVKTLYQTLTIEQVYQVLHDRMEAMPYKGVDYGDPFSDSSLAIAWYAQDHATQEAIRLLRVYRDALDNAPDGVVGVGRITYAEKKLAEAQGGVQ